MNKLPVFRTVGRTFGFVVERRFFTLLRLIWLPTLLSITIALLPAVYEFGHAGFPPDETKLEALHQNSLYWVLEALNVIASLVLGAVIAIAVHRIILRDDVQPGVYFYWRFTGEEFRYILAWFGYFILVGLAFAAPIAAHLHYVATYEGKTMLVAAAEIANKDAPFKEILGDQRLGIAVFLSVLFGFAALARFGLVFPIIVAEERLSFVRSWVVTRGNVMRLIGFWIVTTILAYVLILAMVAVLAAAVAAMVAATFVSNEAGALGIVVLAVPAAVSIAVYLVVGVTLFIAAMSFSYKALTEDQDQDLIA